MDYFLDMLAYKFLNYFDTDTNVLVFMTLVLSTLLVSILFARRTIFIIICILSYVYILFLISCREVALRFAEEQQTVTKYENNYTSQDGKISVSCTNLVNFNNNNCTVEVVRIRTITPWGFAPETETGWIRTYNTERFDYE